MKSLTDTINEGRTNPEAISTYIKKSIIELVQYPYDTLEFTKDFAKALFVGFERGIHEYEKKSPNSENSEKALELLLNIKNDLSKYIE